MQMPPSIPLQHFVLIPPSEIVFQIVREFLQLLHNAGPSFLSQIVGKVILYRFQV